MIEPGEVAEAFIDAAASADVEHAEVEVGVIAIEGGDQFPEGALFPVDFEAKDSEAEESACARDKGLYSS